MVEPPRGDNAEPVASRHGRVARGVGVGIGLFLSALVGAALYLHGPIDRGLVVPPGVDTPAHLWRARLVTATDLNSLFDSTPFDFQVNPDRVGLPVVASVLSGVGVTPWRLMFITPALGAALLGAAGWAFARAAGEPRWAAPIYATALVLSVPFALTTKSYLDNVLADGPMVAAAAALLLVAAGPGAGVMTAALLAAAILMHWAVGGVFAAIGLFFALFLLPESISQHRIGAPWSSTSAGRVGAAVGAGLAMGALPLLVTPGGNVPDRGTGRHFHGNVRRHLPRYRLTLVVAALGLGTVAARFGRRAGRHRHVLLLMAAWLVPPSLAAALYGAGVGLPLMRFLGVAFPLPLLAAALLTTIVVAASRVPGRSRIPVVTAATALVVASLAGLAAVAEDVTDSSLPSITPAELGPIRSAVAYAHHADVSALVIVVPDDPGRAFRRVRMLAPARLIPRIGVFEGTPETLFERADAVDGADPPPGLTGAEAKNALISADAVARMRTPGAIALSLRPFLRDPASVASDPAHEEIADGVFLLGDGPRGAPAGETTSPLVRPISAPPAGRLIRDVVTAFVALLVAGIGWALAFVPAPVDVRVALAPSLGLAGVLLVGTVFGLAGVPLGGETGLLLLGSVAAAGGYFALVRRSPSVAA